MAWFTLVRHAAYAAAANPDFEDALEAAELDHAATYRVRAAGGAIYDSREAAEAAIPGARGHFATLRIAGSEVFVPSSP
jgi:hypothetical protein